MNFSIDLDAAYLPSQIIRKETIRFGRPGTARAKSSSQYINQQTGEIFRTKGQLQSHLGNKLDLSVFDFSTGKLSEYLIQKKNLKKSKSRQMQPPIRQQPKLAKQKVNLFKTQPTSKVNHEIKAPTNDKPKQVFWGKRLSAYKNVNEDELNLPKNIKQFGPDVNSTTAVRSIAAALHLHTNLGIVGQKEFKSAEKNPSVFINPDQPLVHSLVITEDDIRKQEERVRNARKKLSMAFKEDLIV